MNKIVMVLYGLSFMVTIAVFYVMNDLTAPLLNTDYRGGNGNPALFFPVVLMPFIFYFLYGTIELSMRIANKWLGHKKTIIVISLSLIYAICTALWTIRAAGKFRTYIVDTKDEYSNPAEFALLNVFSNDIFFNPFTFLGVVAICFVVGAVWSLERNRGTSV
ncbi:hypothetical protein [Planococcus versutus]|uniref:Uncharacterized protein n=1 Tax=Planococcus versutus TaxID=1302659 RepID=A0A1B1S4S4_9BACL|nr:hypothetical protein [Planococcus versutus]ANU28186.1 hypothetical protein I858_014435 [Planococcus versutus]